jgi:hypothetical protein
MSTWQPIATAPKDGTKVVLLGYVGGDAHGRPLRACIGQWHDPETEPPNLMCAGWLWTSPGYTDRMEPTHWMPLPIVDRGPAYGGEVSEPIKSRCCCPRYVTRKECIRIRYEGRGRVDPYDECVCCCHDEQEDDEYDALTESERVDERAVGAQTARHPPMTDMVTVPRSYLQTLLYGVRQTERNAIRTRERLERALIGGPACGAT